MLVNNNNCLNGHSKKNDVLPNGASFILKNSSSYSFQNYDDLISIDPKASIKLEIKTIEKLERLRLPFIVLNALETPKKNAEIILEYEVGK